METYLNLLRDGLHKFTKNTQYPVQHLVYKGVQEMAVMKITLL